MDGVIDDSATPQETGVAGGRCPYCKQRFSLVIPPEITYKGVRSFLKIIFIYAWALSTVHCYLNILLYLKGIFLRWQSSKQMLIVP